MKINPLAVMIVALLQGCASFDGRGLATGQSTAKDVEALMGVPTERIKLPDGDTAWYYSRQPTGRMMYAVRFSPDGVMRSKEQLLTEQNFARLTREMTTREQARVIVGPPWRTSKLERQQREVWEYTMYNADQEEFLLYLQFSYDGVLREVIVLRDYHKSPGGPSSGGRG
jgi:hypothetical protein